MLTKVLEQQAEILARLTRLEKRERERKNIKDEQNYVPLSNSESLLNFCFIILVMI